MKKSHVALTILAVAAVAANSWCVSDCFNIVGLKAASYLDQFTNFILI